MQRIFCVMALLVVAGCSKPAPPVGKWEGGLDTGGTIVAARVEITAAGGVRVSAPDLTYVTGNSEQINEMRSRLAADLANGWPDVKPRAFDYDGKTFRKPGGVAPQMVWDKDTGQMTLELFIGANPALPVVLRPVAEFHDSPWAQG